MVVEVSLPEEIKKLYFKTEFWGNANKRLTLQQKQNWIQYKKNTKTASQN